MRPKPSTDTAAPPVDGPGGRARPDEPRLTPSRAASLANEWCGYRDEALIAAVLDDMPTGRVGVVTSFGIESAVLLGLVSRVNRRTPVIFVDTGRLFPETLAYRDRLVDHLGLTDVRTVAAAPGQADRLDPNRDLHATDPDACCYLRKVAPYALHLSDFDVEVTGRKRYHGGMRADLVTVERDGARVKINPLAHWDRNAVEAAFTRDGLPRHPLHAAGYDSVGCAVCTRRPRAGEPPRTGRWAGNAKTECGIHFAFSDGRATLVRAHPSPVSTDDPKKEPMK